MRIKFTRYPHHRLIRANPVLWICRRRKARSHSRLPGPGRRSSGAPLTRDPAAELGKVKWERDFDEAAAESKKTGQAPDGSLR